MREILEVNRRLHDVAPSRSGGAKDLVKIPHYLFGLLDDSALYDLAGGGIERDLSGCKQKPVGDDSLRIGSDRGGRFIGAYFVEGHSILRRLPGNGQSQRERECYTLGSVEGQTEKSLCVRGRGLSKLESIVTSSLCNLRKRMGDPRRLVPFPPEGNGCEIRGIGLHQQTIPRYQPHQVVIRPFVERHDPAERDVPSRIKCELGQRVGASVAMEDSEDAGSSGIVNDRAGIVFSVSGMDDDRLVNLISKRDLSRERGPLCFARGIVIVIVESALANGDG